MAHFGVTCDGCGAQNFPGIRYKCLRCNNYDLCEECFVSEVTSMNHVTAHPMSRIEPPPPADRMEAELMSEYLPPDVMQMFDTGRSFTCPFCPLEFTEFRLYDHIMDDHAEVHEPATCPICASAPGGDPSYKSRDIHGHFELRHRPPYRRARSDRRRDPMNMMLQGLIGSREAERTGTGATRSRREQPTPGARSSSARTPVTPQPAGGSTPGHPASALGSTPGALLARLQAQPAPSASEQAAIRKRQAERAAFLRDLLVSSLLPS